MPNSSSEAKTIQARVIGVSGNIVSIETDQPVMKNEVAFVHLGTASDRGRPAPDADPTRLKSEVLRVHGNTADIQVFEDTGGIQVGDAVELTKEMLSAVLGPGLLGVIFDGLQNPLHELAQRDGFFLKRGTTVPALALTTQWEFHPTCKIGDRLKAGDVLGTVPERNITHKIMVPFGQSGDVEIVWIGKGKHRADDCIARVRDARGREQKLTMQQRCCLLYTSDAADERVRV